MNGYDLLPSRSIFLLLMNIFQTAGREHLTVYSIDTQQHRAYDDMCQGINLIDTTCIAILGEPSFLWYFRITLVRPQVSIELF